MKLLTWFKELIPTYEWEDKGNMENRRVRMKDNPDKVGVQVGASFNACGKCFTPVVWNHEKDRPVLIDTFKLQREEPVWRDIF